MVQRDTFYRITLAEARKALELHGGRYGMNEAASYLQRRFKVKQDRTVAIGRCRILVQRILAEGVPRGNGVWWIGGFD